MRTKTRKTDRVKYGGSTLTYLYQLFFRQSGGWESMKPFTNHGPVEKQNVFKENYLLHALGSYAWPNLFS